jgi:hypothetical protein
MKTHLRSLKYSQFYQKRSQRKKNPQRRVIRKRSQERSQRIQRRRKMMIRVKRKTLKILIPTNKSKKVETP